MPGERIKLGLLCLLLLLMLGMVCLAAVDTYRAVRSFQQQNNALKTGDVSTIRGWMTVDVVARLYHVPEDYLSRTLAIGNPALLRHSTLNQIAGKKQQPVNRLIHTVQHAILEYRKSHHSAIRPPKPRLSRDHQGESKPLIFQGGGQVSVPRPYHTTRVRLILYGGTKFQVTTTTGRTE